MHLLVAPSWLASETWRSLVSGVAAVLAGVGVGLWIVLAAPDLRELVVWIGVLVGWSVLVFLHAGLTAFAFRGLADSDLSAALQRARRDRSAGLPQRTVTHLVAGSGDGPSWSVQMSVVALLVVVAVALIPQLQDVPLVTGLGLALVAGCWLDVVIMYALHYARLDDQGGGLEFAGDEPKCFADYVHVALGVQTLGTIGARLSTRVIRRQVALHGLLAFAFNTVIIVMIVSLVLELG